MENLDSGVVIVINLNTLVIYVNILHGPPPSYDLVVLKEYIEFL